MKLIDTYQQTDQQTDIAMKRADITANQVKSWWRRKGTIVKTQDIFIFAELGLKPPSFGVFGHCHWEPILNSPAN